MRRRSVLSLILLFSMLLNLPLTAFAQADRLYLPVIAGGSNNERMISTDVNAAVQQQDTQPHPFAGDRQIRVMTRNLYFGADLLPVLNAPDPTAFVTAVTLAYLAAQSTDFAGRAQAIADEIAATQPLFVGLQEAAIWRTGPAFDPAPATNLEADFAQMILSNLGGTYEIVAAKTGTDAEVPTGVGVDVRITLQDVLLVHSGLKTADLKLSNIQTSNYAHVASAPSPVGTISFPHEWISVDAKVRGKQVRIITTHLEAYDPLVRIGQAQELVAGPANSALPIILIGDFNSQPFYTGDAAANLITSGFSDLWQIAHPADPGLTCCQAADLRNPLSQFDQRIDLVLVRNGPSAVDVQLVGNTPINLPFGVQWASDHAGVVATVQLP